MSDIQNVHAGARSHKSECFPAGSLTICENNRIITIHGSADMAASNSIVHGPILRSSKDFVKMKLG